jgi:hypothetical protein
MWDRAIAACAAFSFFSACTIHPLPEDASGVPTTTIVRQIRCETREAIRTELIGWLRSREHHIPRELGARYDSEQAAAADFRPALLNGPELAKDREIAQWFYDTGIAYTFDFNISETNNLMSDVSLLKALTNSKLTLAIDPTANRKRSNERTFTVTDTFGNLLRKMTDQHCKGQLVAENYIYPITGRIGVDKVVRDFIRLALFGDLSGTPDKPGSEPAPPAPPTMTEDLIFTTDISLQVNPMITFTPVSQALQLSSASITGLADRTDMHQVTIGLAVAKSIPTNLDTQRHSFTGSAGHQLVAGRRVTGGGTPSEVLAVLANDQYKSREIRLVPAQ